MELSPFLRVYLIRYKPNKGAHMNKNYIAALSPFLMIIVLVIFIFLVRLIFG
tara:strand:- start:818 stop:973 length:156 start_codon:yes stop_codon:yes gene_type:complete